MDDPDYHSFDEEDDANWNQNGTRISTKKNHSVNFQRLTQSAMEIENPLKSLRLNIVTKYSSKKELQ